MPRQIPAAVLSPVVGLLRPYRPDLTETALVQALEHCVVGVQPAPMPEALTKAEYGRAVRRSLASVNRDLKTGRLPFVKIGRSVRIPRTAVEHLLAADQPKDE